MQKTIENLISHISLYIDQLIFFRIHIPWNHHYRRKKIQLYPSEELCQMIREAGGDIQHDIAYPAYYDNILYDGDILCTKCGCRDFENNQELMDNVDMEFLENVEHYYEAYKYFSLTLWLDRKLHPVEMDPESVK